MWCGSTTGHQGDRVCRDQGVQGGFNLFQSRDSLSSIVSVCEADGERRDLCKDL